MHLGFSVGAHVQDLDFTHNGYITPDGQQWVAEVPSFSPGFCVNVLGDLRLHKYLNLRLSPGMYFGSKTVEMIAYGTDRKERQDVKSAYVVVPVDLKISGERQRNVCQPHSAELYPILLDNSITLQALGLLLSACLHLISLNLISNKLFST